MIISTDEFSFDFTDAVDAFVFDEKDSAKPTFHGAPMKGVDIVVELTDAYIYVELKEYDDYSNYDILRANTSEDKKKTNASFAWLKEYLKYKFRDSYLYRYAESKVDKPVHYICLITFDNALNNRLKKQLKMELPVGKAAVRWHREIAASCQVVNLETWNRNWSQKWPVTRLAPIPPAAIQPGV